MKKILFDLSVCQPIGNSKFHGGGVYGYIVFKALAEKYADELIAYYNPKKFLPEDITDIISSQGISQKITAPGALVKLYLSGEFEKLYSPLWNQEYEKLFSLNAPIMITQHGLRALEMNRDKYEFKYSVTFIDKVKSLLKQTPYFNRLHKKYYKSYEKIFKYENIEIVTVSEHSRASIQHFYPFVTKNKISVCYSPNTSEAIKAHASSSEKFYLIVSGNRWLKNAYRAILAFDKIFENIPDFKGKVYITGLNPNSKLLKDLRHRDKFVTFDYLERSELEKLYHNAYALIYPSLNEGFGYPPIEAMKYGTPVISSSFASISEICGDAPLYANPYSIDEICMRILELEDDNLYNKKRKLSELQYEIVESRQRKDLDKLINLIIEK